MKKILFLIILVFSLSFWVGCSKTQKIDIEQSETKEIEVLFDSSKSEAHTKNSNVGLEVVTGERHYNSENKKDEVLYTLILDLNKFTNLTSDYTVKALEDASGKAEFKESELKDNKYYIYYLLRIDVTKEVKIKLDTSKYTVEALSEDYTAEIVKPLDYLVIVTKVYFKWEASSEFVFICNDKVIDKDKYTIEKENGKYVLIYKIDDPNWTPYY